MNENCSCNGPSQVMWGINLVLKIRIFVIDYREIKDPFIDPSLGSPLVRYIENSPCIIVRNN